MANVFHIPTLIHIGPFGLLAGVFLFLVLLQRHGERKAQRSWGPPVNRVPPEPKIFTLPLIVVYIVIFSVVAYLVGEAVDRHFSPY